MKQKLFKRSVWTLLTIFFGLLTAISIVGGLIAQDYHSWIDTFFDERRYQIVKAEGEDAADPNDFWYYASDYALRDENGDLALIDIGFIAQSFDKQALRAHSLDVGERVNEEGAVLLWNRNNALPLKQGSKVSTFGVASLKWLMVGDGSGRVEYLENYPTLQQSLESRGFAVNTTLLDAMTSLGLDSYGQLRINLPESGVPYQQKGEVYEYHSTEIPWALLDTTTYGPVEKMVESFGDAAIVTFSRNGGEETDLLGDYTSFTGEELELLQKLTALKAQGKLSCIVLLLNTPNALSLQPVLSMDIDACLWVGQGGSSSTPAVADLLAGNVSPSGHLPDTWAVNIFSAPSSLNFGGTFLQDAQGTPDSFTQEDELLSNNTSVIYQEGIYVGFRYYETRYEDLILGGRNADSKKGVTAGSGTWNYTSEVAFPFGYGNSYTTFAYHDYSVERDEDNYLVSMTIENTGSYPGKEVMQVYLQKPYTEYDLKNGIEKAAVELVGYAKTKELKPGEKQTLTVTVPEYEFKSYDSYGQQTYILEKGDYFLAVGTNAHDALNNILAAKGYTTANGMDFNGNADFAHKINYLLDNFDKYSVSPTGMKVTNQFNDADVNLYSGLSGQHVTYLSRNDWDATWPVPVTLSAANPQFISEMQYEQPIPQDPYAKMPIYGTITSELGALNFAQLKDVPYDDPLWDDLLNQTTFDEQVSMIGNGSMFITGAESVALVSWNVGNGPVGNASNWQTWNLIDGAFYAFPCNPIVAATFNDQLVEEEGHAMAEEFTVAYKLGIYGTCVNIHRNAQGGRAFESFAEDGFLTGKMNAAVTRGLTGEGLVVFTKHFAINDQEAYRCGITTWANEQTIREIYLKAFETGITEANTNGIMTSFNRIGTTWAGKHANLLQNVLRGEWGYEGLIETDASNNKLMSRGSNSIYATSLIAGNNIWLDSLPAESFEEFRNNATVCQAMREAVHRTLYVAANSAAANGITSDTAVVFVQPTWEKALSVVQIAVGIFAGGCFLMALASWIFWFTGSKRKAAGQGGQR